jgi:hypothetical protein
MPIRGEAFSTEIAFLIMRRRLPRLLASAKTLAVTGLAYFEETLGPATDLRTLRMKGRTSSLICSMRSRGPSGSADRQNRGARRVSKAKRDDLAAHGSHVWAVVTPVVSETTTVSVPVVSGQAEAGTVLVFGESPLYEATKVYVPPQVSHRFAAFQEPLPGLSSLQTAAVPEPITCRHMAALHCFVVSPPAM